MFDDDDDYWGMNEEEDDNPVFPPPPERSSSLEFMLLGVCAILGIIFTPFLQKLIAPYVGIEDLTAVMQNFTPKNAALYSDGLLWIQMAGQFGSYILPALLFSHILYDLDAYRYMLADRVPRAINVVLALVFLMASVKCVEALSVWNMGIALPEALRSVERNTGALIQSWLYMPSIKWLILNLFAMAILPAIAEEFWFRGILQRVLARFFRNPHLGIWVTALIFSALHLQFEGFLPRLALGAILGYLAYWSGSLWLSIFIHACFNGSQIIVAYLHPEVIKTIVNSKTVPTVIWWQLLLSIVGTALLAVLIHFANTVNREEYEARLVSND